MTSCDTLVHRNRSTNRYIDLLWRAVPAELPNPLGVVDLGPVEDRHEVVTAIVISFHVELLKLQLDDLH